MAPLAAAIFFASIAGIAAHEAAPSAPTAAALAADDECALSESPECTFNALQIKAVQKQGAVQQDLGESDLGCHTTQPGESCYNEVMWAKNVGMKYHADWYPGLTPSSSTADIQRLVHSKNGAKCPRPCLPKAKLWCEGQVAPTLWAPVMGSAPTEIKILSYNLFWWNLFKLKHGAGNSAGKLIQANMAPDFDVMGFQECEDDKRVLQPVGLLGKYQVFQGNHAICMAYNTQAWTLIDRGEGNVAEDMTTRYYGKRGTQWMRLQHRSTGLKLFFINHHGPLSINSGGMCGGEATSTNILHMMALHAQVGDTIVLVGDFNANAGSLTIQNLWTHLVQAFAGDSFGGVDNVFTNSDKDSVIATKILGKGGSDHDAISATIRVGGQMEMNIVEGAPLQAVSEMTGVQKPGHDWQTYWCGLMEANVGYAFDTGAWSKSLAHGVNDPDRCCRACQADANCAAWVWKDFSQATKGHECLMSGRVPISKNAVDGFVSGLAYTAAAQESRKAAAHALTRV